MSAHIVRTERGAYATLVDGDTSTEYTAHGGLLCVMWNLGNGQGSQYREVTGSLGTRGGTVPVQPGADIARIVQAEFKRGHGYRPKIVEG
jgi:hypothetical protein